MSKEKFFKKIRRRDSREIYLLGHKIFSYSRKNNKKEKYSLSLYEYLDSYKELVQTNDNSHDKSNLENSWETSIDSEKKNLFQYWNSGEDNAPLLVKKCFSSVDKWCSDYNIIRLNDNNLHDYVDIPKHIMDKYQAGIISKAHFSDYLRTCLLLRWGGIWCDATVYMTGPIPKEITSSDFFMFKSDSFCTTNDKNDGYVPSRLMLDLLKDLPSSSNPVICGSSWFLHAGKSNLRILSLVKLILDEYWKREEHLIDYFLFHYVLSFVVVSDDKSREVFSRMPNFCNFNPHLLLNVLYDKYNESLFNEIKSLTSINKLTYQKNANIDGTFIEHILNS
ncbi:capsular polysaccharide synthesis protein [Succinivibrio dextrinosolvens]|uniref:capsular polysaccharide synthesis protein n=1 Tax=Succinivibrio dextrinosolvens TaxID=83771 RepID=UPI001920DC83|nr:capsular polysaccharide synthesis protein [Succinivibrio dextrinosolvens]